MAGQTWNQCLVSAQVAGPTLTAAAAASCIPTHAKLTLPNNFFYIGKKLRICASGIISAAATPGTARFDIRLGGTVVFDSLAMSLNTSGLSNIGWRFQADLTCRAIGNATSTNFWGDGEWASQMVIASPAPTAGGSGFFVLPFNSTPAISSGVDSTAALTLDMFFTQTVATGSMTLEQYSVEDML